MATLTASKRRNLRYSISQDKAAVVEFEYPSPNGRHYRLPLTDLSSSGVSFTVSSDELPGLETGTNLPGAVIRIGDCMIRGDLIVMHVTRESGSGLTCGALLYPATDVDLVKVKSVIAGMEVVEPQ